MSALSVRFASGETVPLPSGKAVDVGRVHVQDLRELDAGLCVSRVQVGVTRSDDAIHVEAKGANPTGVQLDGKAWQGLQAIVAQAALEEEEEEEAELAQACAEQAAVASLRLTLSTSLT